LSQQQRKRKLNFFERIVYKIVVKKIKKKLAHISDEDADKMANTSQAMGIAALVSLFIFPLATIPAGILAIAKRLEGAQTRYRLATNAQEQAKPWVLSVLFCLGLFCLCDCNYFGNRFNSLNLL